MSQDIKSLDDLKEFLIDSDEMIQTLIKESNIDDETKQLLDKLFQQNCYKFSYLMDYLELKD